jgi:hypothetical protein
MLRWTEVDWPKDLIPERLTIRFARFSMDTVLAAPQSP